jgi:hypothetical protein
MKPTFMMCSSVHPPPLIQVGDEGEVVADGGPGGTQGLEAGTRIRSVNS